MRNNKHLFIHPLVAAAIAGAGFSSAAMADTTYLANDNFTNSILTSSTTTVNHAESSGVGTYTKLVSQGGNFSISTVGGFGDGQVLGLVNGSAGYRAFDGGTTLTLGSLALNQTLSLSFDIRFATVPTYDLTFGFVNASASASSVFYLLDDLSSTDTSVGTKFYYRSGSALMSTNGSPITSGSFTEPVTAANTNYHFELSVTRLADGFALSYYRNDLLVASSTAALNSTWAANYGDIDITGVGFRYSSGNSTTYIDNLQVELASAVPEPATWVMMMGGTGILLLGQRLRRRTNG